jgi:hypothetical protein
VIVTPLFPELPPGALVKEFKIKNHGLTRGGELPNGEIYTGLTDPIAGFSQGSRLQQEQGAAGYLLVAGQDFAAVGLDRQSLTKWGWLYKGPSGKVWWVKLPDGTQVFHDFTKPLSLDVTIRRFGAFGDHLKALPPEVYARTIGLADWGQGSPHLPVHHWSEESEGVIVPFSWTPDGRSCVLMVSIKRGIVPGSWDQNAGIQCFGNPYAVGWLLATMSEDAQGEPRISLSLLHDRTVTMGVRTLAEYIPPIVPICPPGTPITARVGRLTMDSKIEDYLWCVYYDGWTLRRHTLSVTAALTIDFNPTGGSCALGTKLGNSTSLQTVEWVIKSDGAVRTTDQLRAETQTDYWAGANYGQAIARDTDWQLEFNGKTWGGTIHTSQYGIPLGTGMGIVALTLNDGSCYESDSYYTSRDGAGGMALRVPDGPLAEFLPMSDGEDNITSSEGDYNQHAVNGLSIRNYRTGPQSGGIGIEIIGGYKGIFGIIGFNRFQQRDATVTPDGVVAFNFFQEILGAPSYLDEPLGREDFPRFAWNPKTRAYSYRVVNIGDPDALDGDVWV